MYIKGKTAWDEFNDDSPTRKEPTAQVIYDYEKHYMNLLSKHKGEISFINNLLKELRIEQENMTEQLLELNQKLDEQSVDEEVKNIWLKHLAENLSRSFQLSNDLISHFMIMDQESFMTALQKRLNS